MWREVVNRELGISRPSSFANRTRASRLATLKLSNTKEIISPHKGAVNTLQVDLTEGRYLLSGASDGSAAVFDIQQATSHDGGHVVSKHRSLFVVDKQLQHGHSYAISSACWYPIDTGLFVTGSYDNYVKVWDTNTTQVELSFKMPGRVYGIAMSSASTSHMLIAAGTEDVQVRLCDIATGAFTHTLSGHRDGVMAVQWSNSSDWVLITGGCDGAIRFWDIRRAGCFRVLDQLDTQIGRRKPLLGDKTSKPSAPKSSGSSGITSLMEQLEQKRAAVGYGAKHSNIVLKGKGKGSLVQRLHPGVSSVHNRATAHYGAVTGLKIADDGMYLVSAGTDSRLRLWDIESGCNTLVNYDALRLHQKKPLQMAISSETVFVPSSTSIKAYDMWSGKNSSIFKGHYEPVNCCSFSASDQELFTGGNDRQILIWSPAVPELIEEDDAIIKGSKCQPDKDAWSD